MVYAFSEEVHAIGATVLVVDFTGDGGESHREWTADYVGIPQNNEEARAALAEFSWTVAAPDDFKEGCV